MHEHQQRTRRKARVVLTVAACLVAMASFTMIRSPGVATAASAGTCAGADTPIGADVASEQADGAAAEEAIVCLTNEQREAAGLPDLSENATLMAVARAHSEDMVSRGFVSHTNPDGLGPDDRLTAADYLFSWYGENIAYRFPSPTPRDFVDAWMNSPGHRANILRTQFTEIGVGLANGTPIDGSTGATATQNFGTPA